MASMNTFPLVTVRIDDSLTLTLCDSTSKPQRTLGVHLSRAAAAQLADLLDAYAKPEGPNGKSAEPIGLVVGTLVGDAIDEDARAPSPPVHVGASH